MYIYLPVAEISIPAETVLLLGAIVGFLSGVFGVGGGFLTTPFLIFMGIPPAVAVGTQTNQLVASSVAGSIGHWRRGNVDFKIGLVMMAGGVAGTAVGIMIFALLQWLGQVDLAISLLYILLLGGIGFMMLTEGLWAATRKPTISQQFNTQKVSGFINRLPYKMRFPRSKLYISVLVPGGIGFVGGVLASIMGIGGGFLLVPAMIYILGMPTILAAGTSLFQIIFITAAASVLHATFNGTVDLLLALLLIIGGVVGTRLGASAGRSIKPAHARITLAILVILVSLQLSWNLFAPPRELYSTVLWG
ncbi:MAG TPA: sulfite exporter TauE/SafE family protein [Alphaproteobacteria bacterium]|nr:sulfite exporter TauE/SafE family protein [Alphaproteobacteria bacterium]